MNAKKRFHAVWFCTSLGVALAFWCWRSSNSFLSRSEVATLGSSTKVERLSANSAHDSESEIEALRETNRKLEEQNQFLAGQLEEARETASKAQAATMKTHRASQEIQAKLNDVLEPLKRDIQSSNLETEVSSGQTVVTGGFEVSDGRFEYTLTTPTVSVDDLGRKVIHLEHKRLAIAGEHLEQLGVKSLATNADNTLQHGETWSPSQTKDFISKINSARGTAGPGGGIDSLSAPRITLLDGQEGEVQIDAYQAKFKAVISESGQGVRLELRTKQPSPKAEQPQ
jgi:hypothetical protein